METRPCLVYVLVINRYHSYAKAKYCKIKVNTVKVSLKRNPPSVKKYLFSPNRYSNYLARNRIIMLKVVEGEEHLLV